MSDAATLPEFKPADYKTDLGVSAATVEEYWVQLAIYASLLEGATGQSVCRLELIFCRPGGAAVLVRHRETTA